MTTPLLLLLLFLLTSCLCSVRAWFTCPEESGGGMCPTHDFCCPSGIPGQSRCVAGARNKTLIEHPGMCCDNGGACGQNYTCAAADDEDDYSCELIPHTVEGQSPPTLPRYPTCSFPADTAKSVSTVYGLPIPKSSNNNKNNNNNNLGEEETTTGAIMAYYSTHGDLQQQQSSLSLIHTVVITIHGSDRNADDYLCGTYAAVPDPARTMVLAPWFLAPGEYWEDDVTYLQWIDDVHPLPHTWRYGADSMQHNISSFAIVDAFLDAILLELPKVETIIVTGHSAGGQFTQRWALLSNHPLLNMSSDKDDDDKRTTTKLRVVAANPKSWVYLDGRRWMATEDGGSWQVPSTEELYHCPMYNDWTWGFDHTVVPELLLSPYKDRAVEMAGGLDAVIQRYPDRFVVYLQGFLDVLPNGDCPDLFQGANRRERSRRFFAYLQTIYNRTIHYRVEVIKVHHDHSLMYASPEGQIALFGNPTELKRLQMQQQQDDGWGETTIATESSPPLVTLSNNDGSLDTKLFITDGKTEQHQQQRPMLRRFVSGDD